MPPVVKQSATARPAAKGKPGSIVSRGVPVSEVAKDEYIHMLLYGRNRVGKTYLACQFPKPLALLSLEQVATGGAKTVSKVAGITYYRLRKSDDVEAMGYELKELCRSGAPPFKSVVIDSGSALDEIVLAEICGWDRTAEMIAVGHTRPGAKVTTDQYTERSERMRKVLRPYLELPMHVVIIANEKDHNPPEGRKSALARGMQAESFFSAAMGGGTARWCQDNCDYVAQLYLDKETRKITNKIGKEDQTVDEETGRIIRRLRTLYHPNFAAGFRSPTPENVPEYVDQPTYEKIARLARGEKVE